MNMSITKVGNVARKSLLPLAAAGALIAGVASCKSNQNAEAPKSEIEHCREVVAKAQEKCYQDSIAFEQADSIFAKQKLAEIQALTKDLPMDALRDYYTESMYRFYNSDNVVAMKKLELAKKTKPMLDFAQQNVDIATGKVLEKSRKVREVARDILNKAQKDSAELAELDKMGEKVDSIKAEMVKDVFSQMSENSAESEALLQKIYDR